MKPSLSDQQIIEGIQNGVDSTLDYVYQLYHSRMLTQIRKWDHSITIQEAEDIFQEAMMVVFLNAHKLDFKLTSAFYTYFFSICRHKWLNTLRKKKQLREVSLEPDMLLNSDDQTEQDVEYADRLSIILEKLKELPLDCQEILRLSIIEAQPIEVVMKEVGHDSRNYHYKRKSNCKDKFTELVKNDARFLDI